MKLNERLRTFRKAKQLYQKDIAKLLGIPTPTYSGFEQGIRCPSYEALIILTDFYTVTIDYLIRDDYEEKLILLKKNPDIAGWWRELPSQDEKKVKQIMQIWDIIN